MEDGMILVYSQFFIAAVVFIASVVYKKKN